MLSPSNTQNAKKRGWNNAFFEFNKQLVNEGIPAIEDARSVDWQYLVDIKKTSTVLLVGCNLGIAAVEIAKRCEKVYIAHSEFAAIHLLQIRSVQQNIDNLFPILIDDPCKLPFKNISFDLIVFANFIIKKPLLSIKTLLKLFNQFLSKNGNVCLSLENKYSFQRLFRPLNNKTGMSIQSYSKYLSTISQCGFTGMESYAPLPHFNRIPLFYVPLKNNNALSYFVKYTFALFNVVTPETKRAYGIQFTIARIGISFISIFKLIGFIRHVVPGFFFIAQKK